MKYLTFLLTILLTFADTFSQPLIPVSWFNWNNGFYTETELSQNPYVKKTVNSYFLEQYSGLNPDTLTKTVLYDLWESLGHPNVVDMQLNDDLSDVVDINSSEEGELGPVFKVFHDSSALYVITRFIDRSRLIDENSSTVLVMHQSKEPDRYEEGYQLSGTLLERNQQYARFIELGGCSHNLKMDGTISSNSSIGQSGFWGTCLGLEPKAKMFQDLDSKWFVIKLDYEDQLLYMEDPWGEYAINNYTPFDRSKHGKISFDIRVDFKINGTSYQYAWNSGQGHCYGMVYYNGYLNFLDQELDTLIPPPPEVSSPLLLCTGGSAVYPEVRGDSLKWYTTATGGEGRFGKPLIDPVSDTSYILFFSQTHQGLESLRSSLQVEIKDIAPEITDDSPVYCHGSNTLRANVPGYHPDSVQFSWNYRGNDFTGSSVELTDITTNEEVKLYAVTSEGCTGETSIFMEFEPTSNPVYGRNVSFDRESGKNKLVYVYDEEELINSLIIMRAHGELKFEPLDTLDFTTDTTYATYIDYASTPDTGYYKYKIHSIDECGNVSEREDFTTNIFLHSYIFEGKLNLIWNKNLGKSITKFKVLKGRKPDDMSQIEELSANVTRASYELGIDKAYYQVLAELPNDPSIVNVYPGFRQSFSNIVEVEGKGDVYRDTVIVYDTVTVVKHISVTDTLFIDLVLSDLNLSNNKNTLKVFPNPTSDKLHVDFGDFYKISDHRIRLISQAGKIIFDVECNTPKYEFSLKEVAESGAYYLQILDHQGKIVDIRIIMLNIMSPLE